MSGEGLELRSRKWLLTVNNPLDYGYTHEFIKEQLKHFSGVTYWCMSDETGEQGTFHTHLFIYSPSAIKAKTLHKYLEKMHRDLCKGTCVQNRDYVFKEGEWLTKEKATTNHRDSHEEYGEIPVERQGQRADLDDLYDMIKANMSTYEILEQSPQYILQIDKIDKVRQAVREASFKGVRRLNLDVTYIWGPTGTGKTQYVMDKYGDENVYRITDYQHPFDAYAAEDVILFEEFRSDLPLSDMLKYLDVYHVNFPARYNNKVACYTKVYIASNIDLRDQYRGVQEHQNLSWQAFLRRVHHVKVFTGVKVVDMETPQYLRDYFPIFNNPFDNEGGGNIG